MGQLRTHMGISRKAHTGYSEIPRHPKSRSLDPPSEQGIFSDRIPESWAKDVSMGLLRSEVLLSGLDREVRFREVISSKIRLSERSHVPGGAPASDE